MKRSSSIRQDSNLAGREEAPPKRTTIAALRVAQEQVFDHEVVALMEEGGQGGEEDAE